MWGISIWEITLFFSNNVSDIGRYGLSSSVRQSKQNCFSVCPRFCGAKAWLLAAPPYPAGEGLRDAPRRMIFFIKFIRRGGFHIRPLFGLYLSFFIKVVFRWCGRIWNPPLQDRGWSNSEPYTPNPRKISPFPCVLSFGRGGARGGEPFSLRKENGSPPRAPPLPKERTHGKGDIFRGFGVYGSEFDHPLSCRGGFHIRPHQRKTTFMKKERYNPNNGRIWNPPLRINLIKNIIRRGASRKPSPAG